MGTTEILVIIAMCVIPIAFVIVVNANSETVLVTFFILFIMSVIIFFVAGAKLKYDYYKEAVNKQQEAIKLEEEAKQDVKDGYAVYVDCKEVDSTAVIFDWSAYKVTINDDTKTVYLEKTSGNVVN